MQTTDNRDKRNKGKKAKFCKFVQVIRFPNILPIKDKGTTV